VSLIGYDEKGKLILIASTATEKKNVVVCDLNSLVL
jgi:hypothetical protein